MTELAPRYTLEPLTDAQSARWDELISPYESAQLFHRSPWLDYLTASRGIDFRFWAIKDLNAVVGYFCGGLVQKGPFRLLGSPLKGWGTNYLGPIVGARFDQVEFLRALDGLAVRERLAMTELESPTLSPDKLEASSYEAIRGWTYLVDLIPGNPDAMWGTLDSTARNRVRKATKAGLTIEDTDDLTIADEFYDQYCELLKQKGFPPPYPRDYARLLVHHLKKADMLFALRVRDASGRLLATGLFPHDRKTVYFWGGASWFDGRHLCPNEFLHWSLMRFAAGSGLQHYDMCGYGRFKRKFGGALIPITRWHKAHWRTARWARRAYQYWFDGLAGRRLWPARLDGNATSLGTTRPRSAVAGSRIRHTDRRYQSWGMRPDASEGI